jgi:oxygen-independent coproporphyrinogen-3 oxidase
MKEATVYVHIPFCVKKCSYCAFNSYADLHHLHQTYVGALVEEIAQSARESGPLRALSLYLGGGTPTVLSSELLARTLKTCAEHCHPVDDVEITIEANPGTVDAAQLSALKALAVNRLSLGVQTFDERMLALLGRVHIEEEATDTYHLAREAGLENINLDFIYGLPTQDLWHWEIDLSKAIDLKPEHLSLYSLSVEEDTALAGRISRGELPSPDPDLAAAMYELAEARLAEAGYVHYEISNWALAGRECQHNMTYWRNQPYLGMGAGAHSFDGRFRYYNVLSPEEYIRRIKTGQEPAMERTRIDRVTEMSETMIMSLRLNEGVSFEAFEERFGLSMVRVYSDEIRQLIELGLLDANGSNLHLTARGRLLGNEVFERFLPPDGG